MVNRIVDCHIKGGSIYQGCSDSKIYGCWVWGQAVGFAIKIDASGVTVENCDVIASASEGGFVLTERARSSRIVNCASDGSYRHIQSGIGIHAVKAYGIVVSGCLFYWNLKNAIYFEDMRFGVVTGNHFFEGNRISDSNSAYYDPAVAYADIEVASKTIASSGNIFSNNTHWNSGTRTTKAAAFKETNAGFAPGVNKYIDNYIYGTAYANPAITRVNAGTSIRGNTGNIITSANGIATTGVGVVSYSVTHGLSIPPAIDQIMIIPTSALNGIVSWHLSLTSDTTFSLIFESKTTSAFSFSWKIVID
jgi:hypothetical protein